ncbi:DJ-1/PfpI family protein [Flavitalea flava]
MPEKDLIVGIPLYKDCILMDFAGATQVFSAPFGFKAIWLAADLNPITTYEGFTLNPQYTFDEHPPIDVLFIPGGNVASVIGKMQDEKFLSFIRSTAHTALWTGSVSSATFILAAADLIRGCNVTTYWTQIPTLEWLSKKMKLEIPYGFPRHLLNEEKRIFTGGGTTSSIDLALQLVLKIKGFEAAEKTQLYIQYAPCPSINSGDPSVALGDISQDLLKARKQENILLTAAVKKLL